MTTKRQREIVERTLEHAVSAVRTIPEAALREFIPQLLEAKRILEAELKAWAMKQDGDATFSAHSRRSALRQIEAALEEIVRLNPSLVAILTASNGVAGAAAIDAMEGQLVAMNSIFGESMVPLSIDRAAVLAKGDELLIKRYPLSAKRYAGEATKAIKGILSKGVLRQQSIFETTQTMMKEIPKAFNSMKFRAHRLVRTEVMNSYNFHHLESLIDANEEDSDVRMRWDASFDRRRCPECADLDGRIVNVTDGKFKANWKTASGAKKASTHRRPPAHPQCRCVLVPWIDDWDELKEYKGSKGEVKKPLGAGDIKKRFSG